MAVLDVFVVDSLVSIGSALGVAIAAARPLIAVGFGVMTASAGFDCFCADFGGVVLSPVVIVGDVE